MKPLKPLVHLLQGSLRVALFRRGIAWLACALLLLVLGSALAQLSAHGRTIRLGLIMAALSSLPAFLLWPLSGKRLLDRLRSIDEETVFEAYLEAEPGPARDILRGLAAERAAALPFLQPPREPLLAGLRGLCGAAIACLVLGEAASILISGRSLTVSLERPEARESGRRIEEKGFSESATEDPAARRARHERALDRKQGENPALGLPEESSGKTASADRAPDLGAGPSSSKGSFGGDAVAKRKQGELEEGGTTSGANASSPPGGPPGLGNREAPGSLAQTGTMPGEKEGVGAPGPLPVPGRTGQGYEHTGDTKVPSPLLDYRSRFEARYAERTGTRVSASGSMSIGELRDFQRRYFDSFTLKAEVGAADDPYVAQLKRRWAELKGGLR